MASSILVTGGTGTLGRLVVPKMRNAGCDVRVLTLNRHDGEEDIEFATGDLSTRRNRSRSRGHRDHRALCWQQQGRQGQGAAPGPGRVACGCAAPGVHLGRWSGQDPGRRRHRPGELLRVQARRRRIVADSGLPSTTLPLWLPGKAARAFRVGANLAPDRAVGRRTWEDFPTARASSPIDGRSGPRFSRLWNCCSMPAPSSVCPSIARRRRSRPQRTPCS